MIVEIEAKFNSKEKAFKAFNRLHETITDVESADLITQKCIQIYIDNHRRSKMRKGLLKFATLGIIMGALVGTIVDLYINVDYNSLNIKSDAGYILLAAGAVTGVLCSILIYFILREKVVPISKNDLKKKEAIVVVSVQKKMLPKLRRILFNNGARSINTV